MNFLKNISWKDILIAGLLGFLVFSQFFYDNDPVEPEPITVVVPGSSGEEGEVLEEVEEEEVEVDHPTIPLVKEKIIVDKEYKEKYDKAIKENDSLRARNLFLKSIEINEYNKKLVDNDSIEINGYAKTRGELLEYKIDYTIKDQEITYTPEVVTQRPGLTVLVGAEAVIPISRTGLDISKNFGVKGKIGIQNRRGNIISAGYDTNGNAYIGYDIALKFGRR